MPQFQLELDGKCKTFVDTRLIEGKTTLRICQLATIAFSLGFEIRQSTLETRNRTNLIGIYSWDAEQQMPHGFRASPVVSCGWTEDETGPLDRPARISRAVSKMR
ncbi:hypothetical protein LJR251_005919 [Rhizobium rhizogenes]|uniref:hypothetical protein n=1 Tax=Rhizobium rhizogenes TaxID=359 RepID=UPI003ED1374D